MIFHQTWCSIFLDKPCVAYICTPYIPHKGTRSIRKRYEPFQKWTPPKSSKVASFLLKPMVLGIPHFRKPPDWLGTWEQWMGWWMGPPSEKRFIPIFGITTSLVQLNLTNCQILVSYGFLWFLMVSYGFLWFLMVSYGFLWFLMVSSGFLWFVVVVVVVGVNAPRRAWFFPRLCSLAVYVFNALADCKMTLPKTRCPTLLLTSCYLEREGGGGVEGMITFLSTVRWCYRRHVAQLCCWRLATLTGRGGGDVVQRTPQ